MRQQNVSFWEVSFIFATNNEDLPAITSYPDSPTISAQSPAVVLGVDKNAFEKLEVATKKGREEDLQAILPKKYYRSNPLFQRSRSLGSTRNRSCSRTAAAKIIQDELSSNKAKVPQKIYMICAIRLFPDIVL